MFTAPGDRVVPPEAVRGINEGKKNTCRVNVEKENGVILSLGKLNSVILKGMQKCELKDKMVDPLPVDQSCELRDYDA